MGLRQSKIKSRYPTSRSRFYVEESEQPERDRCAPAPWRERLVHFKESEEDLDRAAEDCAPKEKRYDPNDPSLVIVDAEDDMDFLYEEFDSPRALMSCGHTVTPTSLTNWCRKQLDEGESDFLCGVTDCDRLWSFEEVQKMALLTPEEVEYFERKMFDNTKDCFDVKSCPGCKSTVLRQDPNNLCVQCLVCTMDRKASFEFCWQCLKEWRGPAPRWDRCQNEGCVDEALETLRNCPTMTFQHVTGVTGCPSVRACPTCGFLLEHDGTGCKNIVCSRCKVEFCFVCLGYTEDCCETSDVFEMCSDGVAPRQARIAALSWDDVLEYESEYESESESDSESEFESEIVSFPRM